MEPWLSGTFGNPSGSHAVARAARQAIDEARDKVAGFLGTAPGDVVFTSGGTEAANLAVLGRAGATAGPVVVSAVEHHAVLHAAQAAGRLFASPVRVVAVGSDGVIDLHALAAALDKTVSIVSVQLVNNEVGTVQPLSEVARLVRRRAPGAVLHTDAVQAPAWLDVAQLAAGADMVSISAHKFGGPQGAGALAFRRPVVLEPLIYGGPQERERRAGTHNVAGVVGMAAALEAAARQRATACEGPGGCGTGSWRACWPASQPRTRRRRARKNCRAIAISSSTGSRARRCSCCSMSTGSLPRPARHAPAAPWSRAMCLSRWATRPRRRSGPCASPSVIPPPRPMWRWLFEPSPPPCRASVSRYCRPWQRRSDVACPCSDVGWGGLLGRGRPDARATATKSSGPR